MNRFDIGSGWAISTGWTADPRVISFEALWLNRVAIVGEIDQARQIKWEERIAGLRHRDWVLDAVLELAKRMQ